ncbi:MULTISPECIES: DUF2019 domain-containing protein [Rhodopseudomonas]|uniref:DUF2019 domain-containing protein n=1 Tax=Rhodopseudomonas palustris TaxID=1076 RepID=A0A0D7E9F9_RHOPL|nr:MULTISPECIES: DUF2019 domain-containing protein [Rhodopseudomonas]KIZ37221.1 hypothetical protein OO17_23855 [Rhodopseudomonas palustris]MDF3811092.1 DUF2019 domain-containing protein [Rhodopseudomonas sp. BAL398]WOK19974.1 DUF2019 domain-containing protein [Rhodopseudomonas sp. BAL398]
MIVQPRNQTASTQELVERFERIALAQDEAIWKDRTARYNRLYEQMDEIRNELRSREGDQRRALIPLLQSENMQVRLKAAITVLSVSPEAARQALESVRDDGYFPQAADARGMLAALDDGTFVLT